MPTLLLHFPAGRYHATPWGHHVNEGQVEWPPSPWRLLRALLATGYAKLGWQAEAPPDIGRALIERLALAPPHYRLPSTSGAHSRHYMPRATLEKGREKTKLVFDTWVQVGGAIVVRWNVAITPEESRILENLAENLGYLGRSESWTVASVVADESPLPEGTDAIPCEGEATPAPGWEQVALLTPIAAGDYALWRQAAVARALLNLPVADLSRKRLTKVERKKIDAVESTYPSDLLACLQVQTTWLKRTGWSQPPGSRLAFYWRRCDAMDVVAVSRKRRGIEVPAVEAMLLSMATVNANDHALPMITRTLPQAEMLHRALVSRSGGLSSVLSGCDEDGQPLKSAHRHAHVIPLDLDGDGHLDHVLVWAPMGLDAGAQDAVRDVRRTFTKGGIVPLRLALAAAGSLSDLSRLPAVCGERLRALIGPATVWQSLTPFVPPRHLKTRGRNTLAGQVASECESRGLPSPKRIDVLDIRGDASLLAHRHFQRVRRMGRTPPVDCGFPLELRFEEPIAGPIVLGYGCHFGLGLFRATG